MHKVNIYLIPPTCLIIKLAHKDMNPLNPSNEEMKENLLTLLAQKAYRLGDFSLASGKKSSHYVNCKPVSLSGEGLLLIRDLDLKERLACNWRNENFFFQKPKRNFQIYKLFELIKLKDFLLFHLMKGSMDSYLYMQV